MKTKAISVIKTPGIMIGVFAVSFLAFYLAATHLKHTVFKRVYSDDKGLAFNSEPTSEPKLVTDSGCGCPFCCGTRN